MKKLFIIALVVLAVSVHVVYTQEIESLSATPRNTVSYLEARLSKGAKLLLFDISAQEDAAGIAKYLTSELSVAFVNSKYFTMVDRSGIADEEMKYQLSGNVSDETAQSMGHRIGAEIVMRGSIELLGTLYRLNIKVVSVKTAEIQAQRAVFLQNDQLLSSLLKPQQVAATQQLVAEQPLWINKSSEYGRATFEGGVTLDRSPWYYEVGISNKAASEQLARTRARQNVQRNIAENIASDMKERIDLTELSLFTAGAGDDALYRVETAITNAIRTKVPRYELLEWFVKTEKEDGRTWYTAYALVRLPKQDVISVIQDLDCTRIATTVTDAVLQAQEATPDVQTVPNYAPTTPDVKAAAIDTLEAELERVRDYALDELRNH
jgi:TolB-like protein